MNIQALLVAQDSEEIIILSHALRLATGRNPVIRHELTQAFTIWSEQPADVIILTLLLDDPLLAVRELRQRVMMPLVMVVDALQEGIHISLLEEGADLVLCRPYSTRLLIAQIRALLRRGNVMPSFILPTIEIAGVMLDPETRTVQVAGHSPQRLSHREFQLLFTLMEHCGQVLSNETIVRRVWGDYTGLTDTELVRGLIYRLRLKIELDPQNPQYILNVPGLGYSFQKDNPA